MTFLQALSQCEGLFDPCYAILLVSKIQNTHGYYVFGYRLFDGKLYGRYMTVSYGYTKACLVDKVYDYFSRKGEGVWYPVHLYTQPGTLAMTSTDWHCFTVDQFYDYHAAEVTKVLMERRYA